MIFSAIYDLSLFLLILLYTPKAIYDYIFNSKYKKSLKARLGINFPVVDKKDKPLVWIHAVSVGETRAIALLAKELSTTYTLLISSITETGHEEAKRSLPFADYHVFLPLDLKIVMGRIVSRVRPSLVIVSETDLWYQFLKASKKYGAKIFLVNGKISEKSYERLKFFSFFSKKIYELINFFVVQSDLYKDRFLSLNVSKNKIAVSGNLKFDAQEKLLTHVEENYWKKSLGILPGQKVITCGSTHENEETLILDAVKEISEKHPNIKIILVPRHPERFNQIEKELRLMNVSFTVFSKFQNGNHNIVLVDVMGALRQCYQVADIAIVGGSFWPKVGGHNILEPLYTGVPVIFGPYMFSQLALVELVKKSVAGEQTDKKNLAKTLDALLSDSKRCLDMGIAGMKLISTFQGSTKRTLHLLQEVLLENK